MADKMEGLLLRLEREVIVARKELNNLRKEMNSTKKMFCKKFNDIQETVEKGYATDSKKRKNVNDKRSTAKALNVGVTSDELCSSRTIGYVHSCFKEKNGIPRQSSVCVTAKATLKIEFPGFTNPEHSLEGLEKFSHIWIIFVFHKNTNKTVRAKVKPPRLDGAKVGVFSSRSPHRPNAIGLSLAKLDGIHGNVLYLSGIDILDGTPVLDVKPYIPLYDQPVAEETDTTETCSSDLMESGETDSASTRQLQQTLTGNNSPGKSITEATHFAQSRAETNPRQGFHCEQRFRENYVLEINSDVAMETDPELEDNVENKTYRDETGEFLSVKSEYNPPSSACQHMVSSGNVAMETTKDARCDTQTINVCSEEPRTSQEDSPSSGSSVCLSKKEKNIYRDKASQHDQRLQEMDVLTCDMRVVKVESVSENSCLHRPKCLSERESPHEIAGSPDRQTQPRTVQSRSPESCHDHTQWLQDETLSNSSGSSPEARSPSREEPYGRVLTRAAMPPHSLFHQEELDRDRSPTRQEGQHSVQQAVADPCLPGKARMIFAPDLPRDGINPQDREFNDRSSVQQTLRERLTHQNCFHDPNSQGSRDLALDNEQQVEGRPLYQTRHLVNRSPPTKSSSTPTRCSPHVFDHSGSMVISSHDQTTLNRCSPHAMTRHSSPQARQTASSPRHSNSTGIAAQDQQCLTRPLVTVPDWIQHPPISKLNVMFSRLAEASLMLFHGKDDININVKQDICHKCIENEKANKAHPASPKSQCVYRLELISSRSSAKRAITNILKSDPRSVYRRNHCPDEPYCFSVDVLNLTCKFEHNTVMVVKIDPMALTREARDKEPTEGGDQLSSSAVQFDPSGHRILLGPHHVDAEVILKNLKDIYDKNQKKTLTGSEQRIANARIDVVATATAEIRRLKVYVQRCPESTRKTGDSIGAIELKVNCERHDRYRTHFYIDLDSVYRTENGEMVYWLDKVEVEERNKWELIIILEFVDGSFRHFQSKAFRIRTKPRTCKQVVLAPSTV